LLKTQIVYVPLGFGKQNLGCMKREYWLYLRGVAFTLVLVSSLSDGHICSCKYNSIDNYYKKKKKKEKEKKKKGKKKMYHFKYYKPVVTKN
jgi:hypothetical protein